MSRDRMEPKRMPAGRYYIGDPCYVFDDDWHELLDCCNYLNDFPTGKWEDKVWANSTAWGDGGYEDQYGFEYGVDAGLIGCVHESVASGEGHGRWHTFTEPFDCYWEDDEGTIVIGDFRIKTDPTYETCWNCGEIEEYCECEDGFEGEDAW